MPTKPLPRANAGFSTDAIIVTVVGGANMDIVARTRLPLAPADSTPGQVACAAGGVARNVAENLARLGHSTHLISVVGDDVFGQTLLQTTRSAGVEVSGCAVLPHARTATYLSVHGPDGDMAMAVNDMAIIEHITPGFLQAQAPALRAAACLVLDCNLPATALACLFDLAAGVPVFADGVSVAKCVRLLPWLARIHTLKVNQLEVQALSGLAVNNMADAQQAAAQLNLRGVAQVVVSMGAQGACWCNARGETGQRAPAPVAVVNTSGAGDAMLSGLVHAHLNQLPLEQAVAWAMACAELTLSSTFANAPELCVAAVQSRLSDAPTPPDDDPTHDPDSLP